MVNNGAVSKSLSYSETYTIPAGYHNGSGKVTAPAKTNPTVTTSVIGVNGGTTNFTPGYATSASCVTLHLGGYTNYVGTLKAYVDLIKSDGTGLNVIYYESGRSGGGMDVHVAMKSNSVPTNILFKGIKIWYECSCGSYDYDGSATVTTFNA